MGGGGVRKRRLETATSKEQQGRTEANTGEECEGGTGSDGQEGALAVTTRTRLPVSSVTEESCDSKSGVEEL